MIVEPKEALKFLRNKSAAAAQRNLESHARAAKDARQIIEMIRRDFNPCRIYQWGSVLKPERFSENSDIDIAVEGIVDAAVFFHLYGKAREMTEFSLDLVQMEKVEPEYAEIIKKKGVIVYDAEKSHQDTAK